MTSSSLATRIKDSFLVNELSSAMGMAAGVLFSILVVRQLGPQDFGAYALATTVAGTLLALAGLGFDGVIGRSVATADEVAARRATGALFRHLVAVRAIVLAVLGAALVAWAEPLAHAYGHPTLAPLAMLVALLALAQGIGDLFCHGLAARMRFLEFRGVQAAVGWLSLAGALALLGAGTLSTPHLLALQVALVLASTVALVWMGADLVGGPPTPVAHGEVYRYALPYWFTAVLTYALAMGMDVLVIGYFFQRGEPAVAYYTIAMGSVGRIAGIVLGGLSGLILPTLSRALAGGGPARMGRAWEIILKVQALLIVPVFAYVLVFSPDLLTLVYSAQYAAAALPFRAALGFNVLIYGLGCGLHGIALAAIGRPGAPSLVRLVTAPLNLGLDLALVPSMGPMGAVVATGIATLATVLGEWAALWRVTGLALPVRFVGLLVGLSAACALAVWPAAMGGTAVVLAAGPVFLALVGGGLLLVRPFSVEDHALFGRQASRVLALVRLLARPVDVAGWPCPACGGERWSIVLATDPVRIQACAGCGLAARLPAPATFATESPAEAADPRQALASIAAGLGPGESVRLEGPYAQGWPALLMGGRWPGVVDPRYRWYLTRGALTHMACAAGLTLESFSTSANLPYPARPGLRALVRDAVFGLAARIGRGDQASAVLRQSGTP